MAAPTFTVKNNTAVTVQHVASGAAGNVKTVTLPDGHQNLGQRQMAMAQGLRFQCQLPSGELGWFVYDAELSTPNNPVPRRVA